MTARRRRIPELQPRGEDIPQTDDHEERVRVLEFTRPPATLHIKVFGDDETVVAGTDAFMFLISRDMHHLRLREVETYITTVSSSGQVNVMLRNGGVDLLTQQAEIDVGEKNSKDALDQPAVDTLNNLVDWGDHISIDVTDDGTGAKGLGVCVTFD